MPQNLWWYPRSSPFPREGFHGHDRLFQADPVQVSGIRSFSVRSVFSRHSSQGDGGQKYIASILAPDRNSSRFIFRVTAANSPRSICPRARAAWLVTSMQSHPAWLILATASMLPETKRKSSGFRIGPGSSLITPSRSIRTARSFSGFFTVPG